MNWSLAALAYRFLWLIAKTFGFPLRASTIIVQSCDLLVETDVRNSSPRKHHETRARFPTLIKLTPPMKVKRFFPFVLQSFWRFWREVNIWIAAKRADGFKHANRVFWTVLADLVSAFKMINLRHVVSFSKIPRHTHFHASIALLAKRIFYVVVISCSYERQNFVSGGKEFEFTSGMLRWLRNRN